MTIGIGRRKFIAGLGAAAAWPGEADAQQPDRMRRVGALFGFAESDSEPKVWASAFMQGLADLGWRDGRNVRFEQRWTTSDPDLIRVGVTQIIALKPDVVLCNTTPVLAALRQSAHSAFPIVFVNITDPVGAGFVTSLARPDGNITGFTSFEYTTAGKWLELLKEVAPSVTRVAVIFNPENPQTPGRLRVIEAVAPTLGAQLTAAGVHDAAEIERAIDEFSHGQNGGLLVLPDSSNVLHRERITTLAAMHRLPAIYPFRLFATNGGLLSYGIDLVDQHRRAASYVDRILKGEQPADLPIQAPTKFELIINLKTAKAIGLTIPESFLLRADEVIE